jgi:glucose dehydrogenase
MYVVTGNDDVFALNAKTGDIIWEYWSGIDQTISTICWSIAVWRWERGKSTSASSTRTSSRWT